MSCFRQSCWKSCALVASEQGPSSGSFRVIESTAALAASAVELACQKAHQRCGIAKPITPHSLRHSLVEVRTMPS